MFFPGLLNLYNVQLQSWGSPVQTRKKATLSPLICNADVPFSTATFSDFSIRTWPFFILSTIQFIHFLVVWTRWYNVRQNVVLQKNLQESKIVKYMWVWIRLVSKQNFSKNVWCMLSTPSAKKMKKPFWRSNLKEEPFFWICIFSIPQPSTKWWNLGGLPEFGLRGRGGLLSGGLQLGAVADTVPQATTIGTALVQRWVAEWGELWKAVEKHGKTKMGTNF